MNVSRHFKLYHTLFGEGHDVFKNVKLLVELITYKVFAFYYEGNPFGKLTQRWRFDPKIYKRENTRLIYRS
jgi:hypothetical protein